MTTNNVDGTNRGFGNTGANNIGEGSPPALVLLQELRHADEARMRLQVMVTRAAATRAMGILETTTKGKVCAFHPGRYASAASCWCICAA